MTKIRSLGLALGVLVLAAACSSDKNDDKKATGSAGAGGSSAGGPASSGSSGAASGGNGMGTEGADCDSDADCTSDLHCLIAQIVQVDSSRAAGLKACARSCGSGFPACKADEMCNTLTRDPSQALCLSTTTEVFKPCGAADTSVCADDLDCLPIVTDEGGVIGVCIQACALPGNMVSAPACPDNLSCIDGLGDPNFGLCATMAERGASCDPTTGVVCGGSDFCISDETGASLCYQDCTDTKTCDGGKTCTAFPDGDGSYCE